MGISKNRCPYCGISLLGRFVPPSPQEVEAYGKEIHYSIDGEQFVDFYAAKGWMIGKNKMKDWKAAVRTWRKRDQKQGQPKKTKLSPIIGKTCSMPKCRMPAVYKDTSGTYDCFLCSTHLPAKVKELYE